MKISSMYNLGKALLKSYFSSKNIFINQKVTKDIRNKALRKSVTTAYYETEFYRKLYDKHGVHPKDIQTVADLPKLPIVTKRDLIDNFKEAIPKSLNIKNAFILGTSGSTGQPVQVYKDYAWVEQFISWNFRIFKNHKLKFTKTVCITDNASSQSMESNTESFAKLFSKKIAFVNVEQDIGKMMDKIEKENPEHLTAYTGVMRELATLKKNGRGKDLKLRKLMVGGEMMDNYTRDYINEAFGCTCFNVYGSTEGGIIAFECPHEKMHIMADTVTIEIIDKDGNPVSNGEDGNILLTCHDGGKGTPIIRYNGCSDVSFLLKDNTCSCGMHTPILGQIKGRSVDSIYLPNGKIYHAFSLTIPMEKIQRQHGKDQVRQYQIVQEDINTININIVRNKEKVQSEDEFKDLLDIIDKSYQEIFGKSVKLSLSEVENIPKGNNPGAPTPLVLSKIGRKIA
ncbi:MAG: phenylacetate--CoA ligase family protein [Desulfobacterales bacterium]|nr:phenylacetate--CoA ligase family protein [Desulfobacterales bacterium]